MHLVKSIFRFQADEAPRKKYAKSYGNFGKLPFLRSDAILSSVSTNRLTFADS